MIDLSHLTEEEQGMIMTVLRRDAELKKAEEERVRKLEKILNSGSETVTERKYLTGEWFYEAKSRRHMDKIHGSEIILASMKPRKAGLDGSLRVERSKAPSSRGPDIVPPPKPARSLDARPPRPRDINSDAEKDNLNSPVRSPRTPRPNPFNRASLIVVEPPENIKDMSSSRDHDSTEIEPVSPLKSHAAAEASQTSGSVTSEGSSAGFRPVPKKRTFISRRNSSQSDSNIPVLEAQVGSLGVVPAPRRSLQRGSSGSSKQSHPKGLEEMPKKSVVSSQVSQFAPPPKSLVENSQQPLCDVSEVSCNFSWERERHPAPVTTDRPATRTRTDLSTDREIPQKSDERFDQREREAVNIVSVHTGSVQGSDRENNSSVGTSTRQGELSLTLNTVDSDPPVSYDLHFIDKSDKKMQTKSNPKSVFKLSTQTSCPTGEDEDSIAKVLDWFNRSTDSLDWPKTEDVQGLKKGSDKRAEIRQFRGEDSSRKYADNVISDRKMETFEMKRNHLQRQTDDAKELRSTDRIGNKALAKTQEEVKKDTSERMWSQEVEDVYDENQAAKISNLKSFWEKSNSGPKILIGKSITPSDKGKKAGHLSVEGDEEKVSDMPSVPGIYNGKGSYDKYTSNGLEREQQVVISSQKDTGDNVPIYNDQEVDSLLMKTSTQRNHNDPSSSDYLKVAASPQVVDKRASDTKVLSVTKLSPQLWTVIQSRLSPESDSVSLVKPKPQPDTISQYKEMLPQDELSKNISVSHLDTDLQTMDSPESDKLYSSRNIPYMEYKQGGGEVQITPKTQIRRGSSEDLKRREIEEHGVPSSMSLKRKEDTSNKDRVNSPHSNRRGSSHQESTAEKIKQLKSFWEQERNNPVFYTGKARALGEGKVTRGANQAKLTKRFTKSEYDLSSMGNYSDSDEEGSERRHQYFNQRLDKLSPSLGTSRIQFNTLRVFWDEATSDNKGSLTFDKPKSPKRKEPLGSQLTDQELKGGDPEVYRVSPAFEKTRPAVVKSSPPSQGRSKSPHDRQTGFGTRAANDAMSNYTTAEQQRESKRSSKDTNRDEKSTKPQSGSGKEARRKDTSSSRGNSMRRARSMFTLSAPDETDQSHFQVDGSPVHSQSRKQRQNAERAAGGSSRSSEETENLTPRARACVPKDYRHYLGMTDETSVHTSLAPAVKSEGSDGKSGYGFDLVGPMRASTPVSSEERYSSRRSSKTSQRPLWSMYSSSDTGPESALSSTSETWSTSRNSSTRDNEDQSQHPVRKALWRAEARPKNLAKSMEDITAPLSPRQERRPDPTADIRRISDVSSVASPSSSLFSDPEHLKKMRKSVPSFLQKEDVGRDTDSTCDESDHRGRLMMGNSLTDLTGSPDMASVSSLSGSVMTMYSGDFGNVEVQGNIQFSINYVQRLREFHIFVAECRDLAAVDPKRGRSDPPRQEEYVDDSKTRPKPSKSGLETKTSLEYYNTVLKYVKSYLLPDKAHLGKRKTSVKKKTLNPTFNEILRYRVRMEYLRTQTLILSVWHHDTFGRNSFLGEVDVDLSKWDFDHTQKNYLPLKARTTPTLVPSNGQGEMRLALRFLPQIIHSEGLAKEAPNAGEVHIWVKECKNLPLVRATIDPFVKCFVLPDTSRKSRQKTRVLRRTADPAFNHTMVYDGIREADLSEACVELTVWDRDRLASNLLGGLRLGVGTGKSFGAAVDWMDSTPFEMALWERMKASPNEWVEDILPLRMMSSAKTAFK